MIKPFVFVVVAWHQFVIVASSQWHLCVYFLLMQIFMQLIWQFGNNWLSILINANSQLEVIISSLKTSAINILWILLFSHSIMEIWCFDVIKFLGTISVKVQINFVWMNPRHARKLIDFRSIFYSNKDEKKNVQNQK